MLHAPHHPLRPSWLRDAGLIYPGRQPRSVFQLPVC
ncbi:Uncharacterised protein [Vibrio cholerae]|nr:Uncharacterised protein [Vibrio cholerae]